MTTTPAVNTFVRPGRGSVREMLVGAVEELRGDLRGRATEVTDVRGDSYRDSIDTAARDLHFLGDAGTAANTATVLAQVDHGLDHLDAGLYSVCEGREKPIARARLQAFQRAISCVQCQS